MSNLCSAEKEMGIGQATSNGKELHRALEHRVPRQTTAHSFCCLGLQAHEASKDRSEPARLSSSCCHSCRFQIVATDAASKAAVSRDKDVSHRGSLLDATLLPPCIQQNAHQIADAAKQAVAVTDIHHQAGRPFAAPDAHASHRDHMRAQLAAYLLD